MKWGGVIRALLTAAALAAFQAQAQPAFAAPLSVPAGGRAGFTLLAPAATGVAFTNLLAEAHSLTNTIVNNGSGLALGDVDGDGLCDIYLASLDGPNALYRNLGGWRFEEITAAAGVACAGDLSTGALLADVDGDGDLDLLVNSIGGGTRLFLNDGSGRFTEKGDSGLLRKLGATSMAFGDLDGDGLPDLYVANYRTSTIMDEPGTRFTLGTRDGRMVVTKVNGQPVANPDYVNRFAVGTTGSPREVGEPDCLYRNLGGGRFERWPLANGSFTDEAGGPIEEPLDWGLAVMIRDLDGDGRADIYVCNDADSPDRVWMNQGGGRFRALPSAALRHSSLSSMGVDVADINRDGEDDIVVVDMLARSHAKRMTQLEKSSRPRLAPGDFLNRPQYPRNTLFLNQGGGVYGEIAHYAGLHAADWAWSPIFLDVDLDGYEDLLVANGFHREVEDIDAAEKIRALKAARPLTPAEELNLRSLFPAWATPNLAFRNRGDLTFEEVGALWGFDTVGISQGMALADLDNDGDLDVVVNNLNAPAGLCRNESSAPRLAIRLRGPRGNPAGLGAKITIRGGPVPTQSQEMVAGGRYMASDDALRVFAASPRGMTVEVRWPGGQVSRVADVHANQLLTLDHAAAGGAKPTPKAPPRPLFAAAPLQGPRHTQPDPPAPQPLLPREIHRAGPAATWFDFNADGWDDLLIGAGAGGAPSLYINQRGAGFALAQIPELAAPAPSDFGAIAAWSPEPGAFTLITAHFNDTTPNSRAPALIRHDSFFGSIDSKPMLTRPGLSFGPLAVADYDGDGRLDLFAGAARLPGRWPAPAPSRLFRNTPAGWVEDAAAAPLLAASGPAASALWSDLDTNGLPDLAVAAEWGPVRLWRNQGGVLIPWNPPVAWHGEARPALAGAKRLGDYLGWWGGVASGDFDGDGRPDLVLGNAGLNNKYREHLARGLLLFHGDVDGDGVHDLIEAIHDGPTERLVPLRDWKTLRGAIPTLADRFDSHAAYAKATVQELLGDPFAGLAELRLNTLESIVLLNRGDSFEARPLPPEAQFAPVFGVVAEDWDGDGLQDLFLAQNHFGPEQNGSRQDAGPGLWLKGDGRGGFEAMPPAATGLRAPGEQRAAAAADYDHDGRPDLVLTQNGAETLLFRNIRALPGLRVRFAGPPGNPQAVGARLRLLDHSGRPGPLVEIQAGSGWLSQSSPTRILTAPFPPAHLEIHWPNGPARRLPIPPNTREITVRAESSEP